MIRKAMFAFATVVSAPAYADTFTATYNELARSPAGYAAAWYSGAVPRWPLSRMPSACCRWPSSGGGMHRLHVRPLSHLQ